MKGKNNNKKKNNQKKYLQETCTGSTKIMKKVLD